MECDNGNVMEQRRARMFMSINLCVDLACTPFIQSTYPLHRQSIIIHQPKSIDVVITTPRALGRWSHRWKIYNMFYILLLEQNITKKEQMNKFVPKFEMDNSKEYKIEVIQNSVIYTKEANRHLPKLYY